MSAKHIPWFPANHHYEQFIPEGVAYWMRHAAYPASEGELDEADRCAKRAGAVATAIVNDARAFLQWSAS